MSQLIEALKTAAAELEARCAFGAADKARAALAAAEAQPAPAPVAWRFAASFWPTLESVPKVLQPHAQPLYAAPVAAAQPDSPKAGSGTSQPVEALRPVCAYISDVLASDATSGEKHIARTAMHLLPLEAAFSAAQPVAVPQGYALVPLEPTPEMWAAVNKLDDEMAAGACDGRGCTIEQAWDCLLAAAPTAPALCACKDRPASACPGEWEPGCDLGNNEAHCVAAPAPQPSEERRQLRHLLDDIVEEAGQDGATYYRIRDGKDILFSNLVGACARLLAQPEAPAPQPLTPLDAEEIRLMLTGETSGAVSLKEFRAVRATERAHGIKGAA